MGHLVRECAACISRYVQPWLHVLQTHVPEKIMAKQHVKGVDATLGATITSEAIVYASAKALKQGQR